MQVNGVGLRGNNVQIEGVDDNQYSTALTVLIPPIEALETVDVSTSNYEGGAGARRRGRHERFPEIRLQ